MIRGRKISAVNILLTQCYLVLQSWKRENLVKNTEKARRAWGEGDVVHVASMKEKSTRVTHHDSDKNHVSHCFLTLTVIL